MERTATLVGMTSELPDSTEAFRFAPDQRVVLGRLRAALGQGPLAALAGQAVAVRFRHDRLAAPALWLLDGAVPRMVLLSPTADPQETRGHLAAAGVRVLVSDEDSELTPAITTLRLDTLDELLRTEPLPDHDRPRPTMATEWLIPTSGTTGTPKVVVHRIETLTRTIRAGASGRDLVWGLAYGLTRFAGLQVLLQALLTGRPLAIAPPDATLAERLEVFAALRVDALSATPSLWRRILMSPAAQQLELRQITLGGEIADEAVLAALAQRWPAARLTHIYASTEAGVGFSVNDGRPGFPATWLTTPPAGIGLAIGRDGTLRLRSAGRPQRLLDGQDLFDADGFMDTGDLVRRDDARFLFVGRRNGAINVGGNKVQPEEVERVLLACPGVLLASVRGRPNPITGMLVAAEVVQEPGLATDLARRAQIAEHCRGSLPAYAIPTIIRFVDEIGLSEAGKTVRAEAAV
jgi:acyl-coenzyme A synthetase/AMP-(fatty) acid ligase